MISKEILGGHDSNIGEFVRPETRVFNVCISSLATLLVTIPKPGGSCASNEEKEIILRHSPLCPFKL